MSEFLFCLLFRCVLCVPSFCIVLFVLLCVVCCVDAVLCVIFLVCFNLLRNMLLIVLCLVCDMREMASAYAHASCVEVCVCMLCMLWCDVSALLFII